jgi:hypothetical protein
MKCLVILYVTFRCANGELEEFGIEKEFEFPFRPMVGDDLTICGDSPFVIASVAYDVDDELIEVRCKGGPHLDYVQRFIDSGFRLHDMGVAVPTSIVWGHNPTTTHAPD